MVSANNAINDTVGASISGVTNTLTITNPSNTASSAARNLITVGGGTAGDPYTTYNVNGVTDWSQGIDNNDSDKWKLSQNATLGTNDTIVAFTSGEVLKPLTPSFMAYPSATINNVTGDGTYYTVVFNTELSDIGGNFDTGTGVFTAPVDGIYYFSTTVLITGMTASHVNYIIDIVTTLQAYRVHQSAAYTLRDDMNRLGFAGSIAVPLSAGNTASVAIYAAGGAKVIDVYNDRATFPGFNFTQFSGYLLG